MIDIRELSGALLNNSGEQQSEGGPVLTSNRLPHMPEIQSFRTTAGSVLSGGPWLAALGTSQTESWCDSRPLEFKPTNQRDSQGSVYKTEKHRARGLRQSFSPKSAPIQMFLQV